MYSTAPAMPLFLGVAEPQTTYRSERVPQPRMEWVEVLVDCPGAQGLYTYHVAALTIQPGDILTVPFGAQQVGGIAIRLLDALPVSLDAATIRPVEEVISQGFFPASYWSLLERVARYYHTPLIQVVRVALPPGLLSRSQRRIRLLLPAALDPTLTASLSPAAAQILSLLQAQKQKDYSWQYLQRQVRYAAAGLRELLQRGWVESYLESPAPVRPKQRQVAILTGSGADLSPKQQEILDVLKRRGGEMWFQELQQTCQVSSSVLKTLVRKGSLVLESREVLRLDANAVQPDFPKTLTLEQDDMLRLEDGRLVGIVAAEEYLYEVRGRDAKHLMQLAWHIGNRHTKAQIVNEWDGIGDRILILRDHVLRDMLIGLGATVTEISEPFSPMDGAYAHDHGHALLNR